MFLGQAGQLVFQGGEIGSLNFDQEIVAGDVYVEIVHFGFNVVSSSGVPIFQGTVETLFAQCANPLSCSWFWVTF